MTNLRISEIDMAERTCIEDDCEKKVLARGLCVTHYHRWNRANREALAPPGICRGCGSEVPRNGQTHPAHYCGPQCRPRCSVEECDRPDFANGWCSAHARRAVRHGSPLAPFVRQKNVGSCEVPDCDQPMRKTGLCAVHYGMQRTYGEIRPKHHEWANEPNCLLCGEPNGLYYGSRKYCSAACRAKTRGPHALSAAELAERDGPLCQICGSDVDMLSGLPDQMCPSVDHIVPMSRGGLNVPENLQLAHLICNRIKGNRSTASLLGGEP